MTPERWAEAKEAYYALASLPEGEREAEIERRLGADPELLSVVRGLLGHEDVPAEFLEGPALGSVGGVVHAFSSGAHEEGEDAALGMTVGHYVLESRLGRGGMGAVYLASRADGAYEHKVAVKVVKRGLDTEDVVRRFRRERQVLAQLQHPNIARLLDGGVTADGRPYLVMEYVEGRQIDRYCEEEGLSVEARLRLFCTVCAAVHSAHQNLVVHRDLKPGNILIDASGEPKLLDFGIAKVLEPEAGGAAEMTAPERRLLTPGYASPEQVLGRPVSTASDVYSLGVVLYQLLSGEAPYRFETGTDDEVRRVVCEVEPQPPATTAKRTRRGGVADADELARRLRGDLDNIVMMAMRKEPERRYASAEQFAADIRRHLEGHPVIARPSTLSYRAAKFVRRNAVGVAAAAVVAAAVAAGVAGVAWQASVARAQRDSAIAAHAEADRANEFLQSILESANAFSRAGHDVTVREVLEGSAERARAELAEHPAVLAPSLAMIGGAYTSLGLYERAEPLLREALALTREIGAAPGHVAERLNDLATLLYARGELEEAEALVREAIALEEEVAAGSEIYLLSLNNLGAVLRARGDLDGAEAALRRALELRLQRFGAGDLAVAETMNNLANILRLRGDLPGAEAMLTESLEVRRDTLGGDHPLVAQSMSNLAVLIHSQHDYDRAEPLYRESLRLLTAALGEEHPDRASTLYGYGMLQRMRGDDEAAEPLLREALEVRAATLPTADPRVLRCQIELSRCLSALSRHEEAAAVIETAMDAVEAPESDAALRQAVRQAAVEVYENGGMSEKAEALR